jgi:leader peptidase (prepilin peptidase) / N-methyltransferase
VELSIGVLWAIYASRSLILIQNLLILGTFPIRWIEIEALHLIGNLVFTWLLVALMLLDAEHLWLPNKLTLPGILLGFIYRFVDFLFDHSFSLQQPDTIRSISATLLIQVFAILVAAGIILLIRWIYKLIRHREGIGLGDAKLMALLAAWLGLPLTLLTFVISTFLGAVASLILLAVPSALADDESWATSKLPFGTFLCIGGIISSLWGQPIVDAYLRSFGF